MGKEPLVSVIMSVYNDEDFVRESIESILNQDFTDFEYLLTDDGSSDSTLAILQEYAKLDSRIKLTINEKNKGIPASINPMVQKAKGKYIARFDGDDIAYPHRLKESVAFMEKNPKYSMMCSSVQLMSAKGEDICKKWQPSNGKRIMKLMSRYNFITQSTLFVRSELLKANPYDETIRDGTEDWDLWKKLAQKGVKLGFQKKVLIRFRLNPNSVRKIWDAGEDKAYFYANVCFNQRRKWNAWRYWKGVKKRNRLKFLVKFLIPTPLRKWLVSRRWY